MASASPPTSLLGPVQASLPLKDWIQRARIFIPEKDYLECAITVALELTNRLSSLVDDDGDGNNGIDGSNSRNNGSRNNNNSISNSNSNSNVCNDDHDFDNMSYEEQEFDNILSDIDFDEKKVSIGVANYNNIKNYNGLAMISHHPSVVLEKQQHELAIQLDDIVIENVIVSLSSSSSSCVLAKDFIATDVTIIRSPNNNDHVGATTHAVASPHRNRNNNALSSRNLCFALGKILFELFSGGEPYVGNVASAEQEVQSPHRFDNGSTSRRRSSSESSLFSELLLDEMDLTDLDMDDDDSTGPATDPPRPYKRCSTSSGMVSSDCVVGSSAVNNANIMNNKNNTSTSTMASSKAMSILQERGLSPSVCQLIFDLLESDPINQHYHNDGIVVSDNTDTAVISSLQEVQFDLDRMRSHPDRFLHDRTCPRQALHDTSLFHNNRSTTTMDDDTSNNDGQQHQHQQEEKDVLYGREHEVSTVMDIAKRVSMHTKNNINASKSGSSNAAFLCEAAFLSGHGGSGKSSVIRKAISSFNVTFDNDNDDAMTTRSDEWSVLYCKFDRQVAPLLTLVQSVDAFFGKFSMLPSSSSSLSSSSTSPSSLTQQQGVNNREDILALSLVRDQMSRSVLSSIDDDSFEQLCVLLPNFGKIFNNNERGGGEGDGSCCLSSVAIMSPQANQTSMRSASAQIGGVGAGKNRLNYLFQIVFKALCSGGLPVAIVLEDLQWVNAATIDIIDDFIQMAGLRGSIDTNTSATASSSSPPSPSSSSSLRGGMLYLGSFRDDEVADDGFLMSHIRGLERAHEGSSNVRSTSIYIGELSRDNIVEILSFKFCLPMRHTRKLGHLVYQKTRGHPMYTIEFLRSIVQKNLMTFSVREKRWVWDESMIDKQSIHEGVVELLTRKLVHLPNDVIETLKIASCFGFQISVSTIRLLDLGQFVPNMMEALDLAAKEGIVKMVGQHSYTFSHDMLQESTYNLIPVNERRPLHKVIGTCLIPPDLESTHSFELCILAVGQINLCKDSDGILDPVERATFARLNLAAGKHSMRASGFEQALGYFEAGITLLHANHWHSQYSLSLELYEMSVAVAFMDGNTETVSERLNEILSNAVSFDDKLNARSLLAKLLVSQERYQEGVRMVLEILAGLEETFPQEITRSHVVSEIESTLPMLKDVTSETILSLPAMTDTRKLNAMKFMDLLITFSAFHLPMLIHILSCRMIKLTFEFGFCEDTISGLITIAYGLMQYSNRTELSKRTNKIAETLIQGSSNLHALRARLTFMSCSVHGVVEPFQSSGQKILNGYNSASIVGDTDNAMLCGLLHSMGAFLLFAELTGIQRNMVKFMHMMAKQKRIGLLHNLMSCFSSCTALIGNGGSITLHSRIKVKTNDELCQIAKETQNSYLMLYVIVNQLFEHCYFRQYSHAVLLVETAQINHTAKRAMDFIVVFYGGLSALCMARDTKQTKWKEIGECSIKAMLQLEECSTWNFENKLLLLRAQLHQLHGHHVMAEIAYRGSISSALEHRFMHEEALACELYGIYFLENKQVHKGLEQLRHAVYKYQQWGATKKADDVKEFMELIIQPFHLWKA